MERKEKGLGMMKEGIRYMVVDIGGKLYKNIICILMWILIFSC